MYQSSPTAAEPSLVGLGPQHHSQESSSESSVTVWEEAWPALKLFSKRLSTQWRWGPGGLIGLDYTIAYAELDRMRLSDEERETCLDHLSIIERAAMETLQPATRT